MKYLFCLLILLPVFLTAQDENLAFKDKIYKNNICSVTFHPDSDPLLPPVLELGQTNATLLLTFDDLDADSKSYTYTVQHFNSRWEPSDIEPFEYIDGFVSDEIDNSDYSISTLIPFTHYEMNFPNEDMTIKFSGNYLLKVYDEDGDQPELAFSRRFMVVDYSTLVEAETRYPRDVSKSRTHIEINFNINHENLKVSNSGRDIDVSILQNDRWDNAVIGLKPFGTKPDQIIYSNDDKLVFPGSKEFRILDIQALTFRSGRIFKIHEKEEGFLVINLTDEVRTFDEYRNYEDIEGKFVVRNRDISSASSYELIRAVEQALVDRLSVEENFDIRESLIRQADNEIRQINQQRLVNDQLKSEYADVIFSLKRSQPYFDKDVYVVGGFTDWELKEEYKMAYNELEKLYETMGFLKQGYYNYMYALVGKDGKIDLSHLEGNSFQTTNNYMIYVYYKPPGSRYDRLVGLSSLRR